MRPARVFACTAIVGGLLVLLVLPPFQAPDEPAHFFRAYSVSEGHVVDTWHERRVGGFVPASFVQVVHVAHGIPFHVEKRQDPREVRALFARPLSPEDRVFVDFPNTALQSPVAYLPQAIGIRVARLFGLPAIALFYAGRLANLACWIFVMAVAVRTAPLGKWLLLATALAPMSLQQAASLSADALTNSISFLFIALCLRARFATGLLARRDLLTLSLLAGLVALGKIGYLLLPLTLLLIPEDRFGSARQRRAVLAGMLALAAVCALAWSAAARVLYATYDAYSSAHRDFVALIPGVEPGHQLAFIVEEPARYVGILAVSLGQGGEFILRSFVGQLGWGEASLPAGHVPAYLVLLLVLALLDEPQAAALSGKERAFLGLLACGSLALVGTALYLHWTPVGQPHVNGLHGRYLIPFAPVAFLALQSSRLRVSPHWLRRVTALGVGLSTAMMIATLLFRYY